MRQSIAIGSRSREKVRSIDSLIHLEGKEMIRADRKSQGRQYLGFCTADFGFWPMNQLNFITQTLPNLRLPISPAYEI